MDFLEENLALARLFDDSLSSTESETSTNICTPRSTSPEATEHKSQEENTYNDSIPDGSNTKAEETNVKVSPLEKLRRQIDQGWEDRQRFSRYKEVVVCLIHWEDHDIGGDMDETTDKYEWIFKKLYNYEVRRVLIPSKKPHLSLLNDLMSLAARDSPETLFIIWYDGHGKEHPDRRGSPRWTSHGDANIAQTVDSSIISTTLSDCEADILLVNNCCNSVTCDRFTGTGIVESISASAFDTETYGSINAYTSELSPSMTWAAYKILSDKTCVEDGITVAELHRRICLATQWAGSNKEAYEDDWGESNIRTRPVYTRLSADSAGPGGKTRSIVLRRLEPSIHSLGVSPCRHIQLRLGIDHGEAAIDPDEWAGWIKSAPRGVKKVSKT
ncbi:hypothetical protein F5Y10DRAFT_283638 [Nemania abortiva]|nr:hypothetical protein F5Y10DRAFT_283638 [Nemania abortiva]